MSLLNSAFLCLVVLLLSGLSQAQSRINYYGEKFYQDLQSGAHDQELAADLKLILKSKHLQTAGQLDKISASCSDPKSCYEHTAIGYGAARVFLFSYFYLVQNGNHYTVTDVYCGKEYEVPGPNGIPGSDIMNVEHTWPQSKFTHAYPTDTQKSDLHHLFPSDSKLNSDRGNFPFGEVARKVKDLKCPVSQLGYPENSNQLSFEPPVAHRGNVARALFYFAIRYDMKIDQLQERFLRKWNQEDPVDQQELDRNKAIQQAQGNRNPFVDYPELVDRISDF